VNIFVSNTDFNWYTYLHKQPAIDEVNFWKPQGGTGFRYLREGELFFFKLKKEHQGKIVGFGQFLMFQRMSVVDAWDTFGVSNGAGSSQEMMRRIAHYANGNTINWNHEIGCIIITNPVFFPKEYWVDAPEDWKDQIVTGKGYSMFEEVGKRIYFDCIQTAEMLRGTLV
jgi:putative restriction endonuclease